MAVADKVPAILGWFQELVNAKPRRVVSYFEFLPWSHGDTEKSRSLFNLPSRVFCRFTDLRDSVSRWLRKGKLGHYPTAKEFNTVLILIEAEKCAPGPRRFVGAKLGLTNHAVLGGE